MDINEKKQQFNIAFNLHKEGNIKEAKILYEKILDNFPNDAEILNLKGLCELSFKEYESAEKSISKAISIKCKDFFFESLARVYSESQQYKKEQEILLSAEKLFGLNYNFAFLL